MPVTALEQPVSKLDSIAAYIDTTIKLTENLSMLAGIRYSKDYKDNTINEINLPSLDALSSISAAGNWGSVIPRVGLRIPNYVRYHGESVGLEGI